MQFSFEGAQQLCTTHTNAQAVVTIWFVQTNNTYLYAEVDKHGQVSADELTVRDSQDIRRVVATKTSEEILGIFMDSVGRVTAATLTRREETGREGHNFYLKRTARGWVIHDRGSWKSIQDIPPRPTSPLQPTAAAPFRFRRLGEIRRPLASSELCSPAAVAERKC